MSMKILWQIIHTLEVSMERLAAVAGRRNVLPRAVSILKLRVLNPRKLCSPEQTRTVCHPTCSKCKGVDFP